jgi:hypothetical protein
MPSIETASIPVASFPNEYSSPYGDDEIIPLYSSVPIKNIIKGCLPCVVCGDTTQRKQIITSSASQGLHVGTRAIGITLSKFQNKPLCNSTGIFVAHYPVGDMTVSGTWGVSYYKNIIGLTQIQNSFLNVTYNYTSDFYGRNNKTSLIASLNPNSLIWEGISTQVITPPDVFQKGGTGSWSNQALPVEYGFSPTFQENGTIDIAPFNPPIGTTYVASLVEVRLNSNTCP